MRSYNVGKNSAERRLGLRAIADYVSNNDL